MKKLLSLALCAAAATSFAAGDEITLGDEIGVTMVTLPEGQKETIIAASFVDLDTGDVSIANLVKTTGLAVGDEILLYTAKDTYSAWKLNADKAWEKAAKMYEVNANGVAVESNGDDPKTTTATVGTGLWIVRKDAKEATTIAIYGKYTEGRKSTITARAWNLVGNAGLKPYTFTDGVAGDKLIAVKNGARREYTYDGTKWTYSKHTTETVKFMGKDTVIAKETAVEGDPTIEPGEGFWYHTDTTKTVSWQDSK